jgi:uncharacterized protein (DUF952 family)/protein-tyrosine phosphatase
MIYHLTTLPEWQKAQEEGVYIPSGFDKDGFIHCSDHYQIKSTANRFYRETPQLIVLEIDPDLSGAELVYENLEGGEMPYPHLYGTLPVSAVKAVHELGHQPNGDVSLPDALIHPEPELFTEILFGQPGRVFRSPTPGSKHFDPEDRVLELYKEANIAVVVVLNSIEEHLRYSERELLPLYEQAGIQVIYDPVPDFSAPPQGTWDTSLDKVAELLRQGKNVAIHCHAGVGRTGIFTACLAQDLLGLSPEASIEWVRRFIPFAVETQFQQQYVFAHRQ